MKHKCGLVTCGVAAFIFLGACAVLSPQSRVRTGELYRPGEARYDAYFAEVHELQSRMAKLDEERLAARRPLAQELKVDDLASESTLAQLSRERLEGASPTLSAKLDCEAGSLKVTTSGPAGDGGADRVARSVEAVSKAELRRAQELRALGARVEQLERTGHELEQHVAEDFARVGGQKPNEVKQELAASFDVLAAALRRALREGTGAEHFVANLARAVNVNPSPAPPPAAAAPPAASSAKPASPSPPRPPVAAAPVPPRPPATTPAPPAPPTPPKPPTPPPGDVFNP